jgi:hypothetical protein
MDSPLLYEPPGGEIVPAPTGLVLVVKMNSEGVGEHPENKIAIADTTATSRMKPLNFPISNLLSFCMIKKALLIMVIIYPWVFVNKT